MAVGKRGRAISAGRLLKDHGTQLGVQVSNMALIVLHDVQPVTLELKDGSIALHVTLNGFILYCSSPALLYPIPPHILAFERDTTQVLNNMQLSRHEVLNY